MISKINASILLRSHAQKSFPQKIAKLLKFTPYFKGIFKFQTYYIFCFLLHFIGIFRSLLFSLNFRFNLVELGRHQANFVLLKIKNLGATEFQPQQNLLKSYFSVSSKFSGYSRVAPAYFFYYLEIDLDCKCEIEFFGRYRIFFKILHNH